MDRLYVIKIGGNIIDDEALLSAFLQEFAALEGHKILVHGGGKIATELASRLGIVQELKDGRRITDEETIKLVTMVYGGLINKNIVARLQSLWCNAIGLSGADANLIPSNRRPVVNGTDYGFVGDPVGTLDTGNWQFFLDHNFIPVIAPLTHDGKGQLLNTNADTIAGVIATTLSNLYEVHLVYGFEKNGVLQDINDASSVVSNINPERYKQLKAQGIIVAGMIPKLDNAFAALQSGVTKVIIGKAHSLSSLINGTTGTTISYG